MSGNCEEVNKIMNAFQIFLTSCLVIDFIRYYIEFFLYSEEDTQRIGALLGISLRAFIITGVWVFL